MSFSHWSMLMGTMKADAETLRVGLLVGLVDVHEVVSWADRIIVDDRVAEAPVVLDLAVSGTRSIAQLVSLLGTVPGDADKQTVGRRIACRLHRHLATGKLAIAPTARVMYWLVREGYSPDADFADMACHADDGVDLAQQGIFGTLKDLASETTTFLQRYDNEADPLTQSE